MKIFQIIDTSVPQEIREEALATAQALKSHGNIVEIFHRLDEEQLAPFKESGLTVHKCRLGGAFDFISPIIISRGINKDDAVVLELFTTDALLCAVRTRQLAPDGARVAITLHSGRRLPDFSRPARERLADEVNAFIFPFDDDRQRFKEVMPYIREEKLHVIYPSLMHNCPLPSPDDKPSTHSPFTLLFYGSITPEKGLDRFIAALENLTSDNLKAIIIGTGQGRDVMPVIRRTRASAVESKIVWEGDPRNPDSIISKADAAIFPAVRECDDYRSLLAAMRHGLPIIASARSSAPHIFKNSEQYMAVDTDNPEVLSEAIRTLTSDTSLRLRLSNNSLQRFSTLDKETDTTERLQSVYISLLTSAR